MEPKERARAVRAAVGSGDVARARELWAESGEGRWSTVEWATWAGTNERDAIVLLGGLRGLVGGAA